MFIFTGNGCNTNTNCNTIWQILSRLLIFCAPAFAGALFILRIWESRGKLISVYIGGKLWR